MIDKSIRSAVILAAGKGTRFGGSTSKCVCKFPLDKSGKSYLTPLSATMNACLASGIFDFHIVVGYDKSSVIAEGDRLIRIYGKDKVKITYVDVSSDGNDYNRNLSIKRGIVSAHLAGAEEIYIMNGDTLVAPKFIERLVDAPNVAMLVRSSKYLDEPMEYSVSSSNGILTDIRKSVDNPDDPYYCCEVFKLCRTDCGPKGVGFEWDGSDGDYGLLNAILKDSQYACHSVFVHPTDGIYDINTIEDYNKTKHMLNVL